MAANGGWSARIHPDHSHMPNAERWQRRLLTASCALLGQMHELSKILLNATRALRSGCVHVVVAGNHKAWEPAQHATRFRIARNTTPKNEHSLLEKRSQLCSRQLELCIHGLRGDVPAQNDEICARNCLNSQAKDATKVHAPGFCLAIDCTVARCCSSENRLDRPARKRLDVPITRLLQADMSRCSPIGGVPKHLAERRRGREVNVGQMRDANCAPHGVLLSVVLATRNRKSN